jgi:hypothetical protein
MFDRGLKSRNGYVGADLRVCPGILGSTTEGTEKFGVGRGDVCVAPTIWKHT